MLKDYRRCIYLFQSFILIDGEGTPLQELAALEVNRSTHAIVDVFHAYARSEESDIFARKHVHGLNRDFLIVCGHPSESELITAFKSWLSFKPYVALFANGAHREAEFLDMPVGEFNLAPWAERKDYASHQIATRFKELSIPVNHRSCNRHVHSSFVSAPPSSNAATQLAKTRHGFHCALYDCVELYFQFIMY